MRDDKKVFLSYRRALSVDFAGRVRGHLKAAGFDVFFEARGPAWLTWPVGLGLRPADFASPEEIYRGTDTRVSEFGLRASLGRAPFYRVKALDSPWSNPVETSP
jgi:hypothetical protein